MCVSANLFRTVLAGHVALLSEDVPKSQPEHVEPEVDDGSRGVLPLHGVDLGLAFSAV